MAVAGFFRSARESFAVGWKIESNWTDPVLFATYRIVQPLASLMIVAFIVIIGGTYGTGLPKDYLARLIVSNAFFVYVAQVMMTMGWLVHTDRSRYEVLKNIYISPGTLHPYMVGRSLVSVLNATISVIISLLFSVLLFNGLLNLGLPLDLLTVNLLMLVPAVVLGCASLIAIGYILCAVNIVSNRMEFILAESVSGIFFLLGGVIFPPSALPEWVQPLSAALPVTHFLAAVRDSFFPAAGLNTYLLNIGYLALATAVTALVGVLVFRVAEHRAKQLGLFDRKSEY